MSRTASGGIRFLPSADVCANISRTARPLWSFSGSIVLQELLSIKLDHNDSCPCCRIMFAEQTHHAPKGAHHGTIVLHHCTQVHRPLWSHSGSINLQELLSIKLDHNDSCPCCRIMFAEQTLHAPKGALHSTSVLLHCPNARIASICIEKLSKLVHF